MYPSFYNCVNAAAEAGEIIYFIMENERILNVV